MSTIAERLKELEKEHEKLRMMIKEEEEEESIDMNRIMIAFTPLVFHALGKLVMLASLRFIVKKYLGGNGSR